MKHTQVHPGSSFGDDPWIIRENGFQPAQVGLCESLFALGNGQLGIRGDFEEGYPTAVDNALPGTYWNGSYVQRPILYGENAPGFPQWADFMPAIMNGRELSLTLNGQPLNQGQIIAHQRLLHLHHGLITRSTRWRGAQNEGLTVSVETLVSFTRPGLIAQRITLQAGAQPLDLALTSWLRATRLNLVHGDDPRVSGGAQDQLQWLNDWDDSALALIGARQAVANGTINSVVGLTLPDHSVIHEPQGIGLTYQRPLTAHQTLVFERFILYQASPSDQAGPSTTDRNNTERCNHNARPALHQALAQARQAGFEALAAEQRDDWHAFWQRAHVSIHNQPLLEQGLRFNLFQLRQSCSRDALANIAAKGLSGPGYDGHYFWDSEIYVLPLFSLLEPDTARALLRHRIAQLPQARQRAREMSHLQGALYPWRTISGNECSGFFPAGTAQYHINADIAYAVQRYLRDSGDWDFVLHEAAEMVLDTARIWMELGHFNPQLDGHFSIHQVTGPDEYTAMVDNNYYTNLLAARHLAFAARISDALQEQQPDDWRALCARLQLTQDEIQRWREAAAGMYLPEDVARDISWQDDQFAHRPAWDYQKHPADEIPMLLKHHPLVLYRHQILKQADVLMAHYLCPEHSTTQRKANDFNLYEPLTTHDSSLSPCVHSIIAAWTGQQDKALNYLNMAVRSDLDDLHGNSNHGLHIAAMAGSLACLYHGFAGLHGVHRHSSVRTADGDTSVSTSPASSQTPDELHLSPALPTGWQGYSIRFSYHGSLLELRVNRLRADTADDAQSDASAIDAQVFLLAGPPRQLWLYNQRYDARPGATEPLPDIALSATQGPG